MSDPNKPEKPKIIVDSDWKAEAQREKERLAQEAKQAATSGARAYAGPPQADFSGLVNVLGMQALVSLGGMRGPGGQPIPPNPELAKYHIDLLDVLADKTKNNVSEEEKRLLDLTLYELRMRYVQIVGSASGLAGGAVGLGGEKP